MNRRRLLLTAAGLPLLTPALAWAADGPEAVVDRFLAANAAGDLTPVRDLLADEAADWKAGPVIDKGRDFKVVEWGEGSSVARIWARRPDDASPDSYLFLRREAGSWKIIAFRALATLELIIVLRRSLRRGDLPEQDGARLANLDLILASDAELRTWFAAHRGQCEDFMALVRRSRPEDKAALQARVEAMDFGSYVDGDPFQLVLGGMIDNSVGFLWTQGPAPTMDVSGYIWIEPLGGGWYLFKTT